MTLESDGGNLINGLRKLPGYNLHRARSFPKESNASPSNRAMRDDKTDVCDETVVGNFQINVVLDCLCEMWVMSGQAELSRFSAGVLKRRSLLNGEDYNHYSKL